MHYYFNVIFKRMIDFFGGISHCSLGSPNRVCNIGWAENGPGAVICPFFSSVFQGKKDAWYAHEYIDELRAEWLVYNA